MKNKILINKIKCLKCGDIIVSTHRHDFKWCKCKSVFVDTCKILATHCEAFKKE